MYYLCYHLTIHPSLFLGNECMKILNNVEKLNIPEEFDNFVDAFLVLQSVNQLVSSPKLPENYAEVLANWRQVWSVLYSKRRITETNKVHILIDHLEV